MLTLKLGNCHSPEKDLFSKSPVFHSTVFTTCSYFPFQFLENCKSIKERETAQYSQEILRINFFQRAIGKLHFPLY